MSEVMFNFQGKNFIVIGASSGVGKQIALELLQAGANVFAVSRRKELMDEIYRDYSSQVITAGFDVKNFNDWDSVLKIFVNAKGKFDGSVYTAGISHVCSLRALELTDVQNVMDTNFFGALFFLKKFFRNAYINQGTSSVLISSIAASFGNKSMSAYSASKGALFSAMTDIATEVSSKNHRINAISPGWLETPMTQNGISEYHSTSRYLLNRKGTPEDISGMALFLLSDRASWITGTNIVIDGGFLAG